MTEEKYADFHNKFQPSELQTESPFIFEFGPVYDLNIDYLKCTFKSVDGKVRQLSKTILVPRDTEMHTYELYWLADNLSYEIYIDHEPVAVGLIN
jgi:hypothetical protein